MTSVGPGSSIQRSCSSVITSVVTTMIDSSAERVDPHGGEHVPRDGGERRLVDGDAGLVGDLDTHASSALAAAFARS